MNDYKLTGKVAIITGAGQGIGKAAALAAANSGASVILCGRTLEKLEKAAEEIRALGVKALPVKMDVTNLADIERAVAEGVKAFGHIDILFNCAGIWKPSKLVDLEPEFWDNMMDINLKGAVFMSREVARHMIKNGIHGTIELISSQAGKVGEYGNSTYGASKSAMDAWCQAVALELGEYDINVVAVAPGFTYTEMLKDVYAKRGALEGNDPESYAQEVAAGVPLKRMAAPEEVGSMMAYLASEDASYITGVVLTIAGGNITV
ncbi:MAG: SDR family oxidoreductase [Clostridiales Family XIII bacterium]|uniref:SDR family NAD(P)-dependent oxidoreductase n=1 Tax=Hominibacterium faecale TaxID=2839743 RepID=UPI0022B296CE|nr:SDR family oxidoreductase [Hominibacterium faecale]MDE8734822.1 SDR family NAD(P)-dependent oxidoreductase [Eubacteriales bacterium DFI.9.88]MDY3010548.1 SDR family oxidoreductase [Clostridiales Family XIII bacterium]